MNNKNKFAQKGNKSLTIHLKVGIMIEKKELAMIKIHEVSSIYKYETEKKSWASDPPRNWYNLAYQVSGSYEHRFQEKTLSVPANTLFFINKNDVYSVRRIEQGSSISVIFSAELDFPTTTLDCSDNPHVYNLFQKLLRLHNLELESNRCLATAIVYELFSILYKKKEQAYMTSTSVGRLEIAKNYILAHYQEEEISTERLAKLCNIGVKHFRELFKKQYKTTPTQFIIDLRMRNAVKLLSESVFSINEVAESVGIGDPYYFSRLFKKRFGVSPTQFRHAQTNKIQIR